MNFKFALQKPFFIPNSFNTLENIKNINVPKLVVHGTQDEIIDYTQ
jgi:fermentation-respiration switch protein FrsA (DUF1100 family)